MVYYQVWVEEDDEDDDKWGVVEWVGEDEDECGDREEDGIQ